MKQKNDIKEKLYAKKENVDEALRTFRRPGEKQESLFDAEPEEKS